MGHINNFSNELQEITVAANGKPDKLYALRNKLDELCAFIVNEENGMHWEQWEARQELQEQASLLRDLSAQAAGVAEKLRAALACSGEGISDLYIAMLTKAASAECSLIGNTANARVVFVGAGSFPLSALTILQKTSAQVLCTDIDEEAVSWGKQVLNLLGPKNTRRWTYESSHAPSSYFLDGATHVIVASLVPCKLELLKQIIPQLKSECKLLLRYGNGLKSLFNYPIDTDHLSGLQTIKDLKITAIRDRRKVCDTLLLQKKEAGINIYSIAAEVN